VNEGQAKLQNDCTILTARISNRTAQDVKTMWSFLGREVILLKNLRNIGIFPFEFIQKKFEFNFLALNKNYYVNIAYFVERCSGTSILFICDR
jgi:hypothetical protein